MGLGRFVRHLRLQFQLVLAPVFLLGYSLTGALPDGALLVLFLLLHLGLYGGATAYNSYYDRDEGPIGGMKYPPVAGSFERFGGLVLQVMAVGAMSWWGWRMVVAGLSMLLMGLAYSHPRWRWKARPLKSLLTVTVGQGLLPFFMGMEAAPQIPNQLGVQETVLTACAVALVITGLYPLTQVYQIDEDRTRGDCTFAVHHGPEKVFALSRGLVGMGMGLLGWVLLTGTVFHTFWIWVLPAAYLIFWIAVQTWAKRFDDQTTYQNHDWAFGISLGTSGAFWIFLVVEFVYHIGP